MRHLRLVTAMGPALVVLSLTGVASAQQYPPPYSPPMPPPMSPYNAPMAPPPMSPYNAPMAPPPMSPYYPPMAPTMAPYSAPRAAPAPASAAVLGGVTIVDNSFQPGQTTVNQGDPLVWSDSGRNPHTVTADDGSFDSSNGSLATLVTGQTFSHAFSAPGTFRYHCKIHGAAGGVGMSGVIVVRATATSAPAAPAAPAAAPPSAVVPGQMALTGRPIAPSLALGLLVLVLGSMLKATAMWRLSRRGAIRAS